MAHLSRNFPPHTNKEVTSYRFANDVTEIIEAVQQMYGFNRTTAIEFIIRQYAQSNGIALTQHVHAPHAKGVFNGNVSVNSMTINDNPTNSPTKTKGKKR